MNSFASLEAAASVISLSSCAYNSCYCTHTHTGQGCCTWALKNTFYLVASVNIKILPVRPLFCPQRLNSNSKETTTANQRLRRAKKWHQQHTHNNSAEPATTTTTVTAATDPATPFLPSLVVSNNGLLTVGFWFSLFLLLPGQKASSCRRSLSLSLSELSWDERKKSDRHRDQRRRKTYSGLFK